MLVILSGAGPAIRTGIKPIIFKPEGGQVKVNRFCSAVLPPMQVSEITQESTS